VLFDFFGTLTRANRRGAGHTLVSRWLGVDPDAFAAELDRTFYARAAGGYGQPVHALRRIARRLGADPDDGILAVAAAARVYALRADTVLRPEAVPLLAELRNRGLRTAVVSDCWYELPTFMPYLPVAPLLDACVYSVHIGHCKPHPAMYLTACARLGVGPDECLYVGDGGSQELSGAVATGIPAVRLAAPDLGGHLVFRADEHWTGPSVDNLFDVLPLLDRVPVMV
jgi:putative hydrolase of the HAD superfamily